MLGVVQICHKGLRPGIGRTRLHSRRPSAARAGRQGPEQKRIHAGEFLDPARQRSTVSPLPFLSPLKTQSSACFSSSVSRRTLPLESCPSSSGPIATRTNRSTATSSNASIRRMWRFRPSSRTISSQELRFPQRRIRTPATRRKSPSSVFTPLPIASSNVVSATSVNLYVVRLVQVRCGDRHLAAHSESLVRRSRPSLALSRRPTGATQGRSALRNAYTVCRPFSSEAVVTAPRGLLSRR